MNVKELDAELREIEKAKAELGKLDYNDPKYDDLEEKLHDLEDDFQDKHGEYLEDHLRWEVPRKTRKGLHLPAKTCFSQTPGFHSICQVSPFQ